MVFIGIFSRNIVQLSYMGSQYFSFCILVHGDVALKQITQLKKIA